MRAPGRAPAGAGALRYPPAIGRPHTSRTSAARWPRRRAAAGASILAAVVLGAASVTACGGSGSSPEPTTATTQRAPGSTTGRPGPTTGTPDLGAVHLKLTKVAALEQGTALAVRRNDPTLYVIEQTGRVRAVRGGVLAPRPVLDLSGRVSTGGERGLLGIAFSPDGKLLYLDYTGTDGDTRVDEYPMRADGTADAARRRSVLGVTQPQPNHNGGEIAFGPDGFLYIGLGDGGGAGDEGAGHAPGGNGQSLDTLLGKILRIDPRPSGGHAYTVPPGNPFARGGGRPEIWAYGLRNPWRFGFDRTTGDLWIADVGQNTWEEVDRLPAARGGANLGWNVFEGTHRFRDGDAPGAVAPVYEYSHEATGGCSVTGGYVYRGRAVAHLAGAFVFSDYCTGRIQALAPREGGAAEVRDLGVQAPQVSSFGQDAAGELYVISQRDGLFRIDPA